MSRPVQRHPSTTRVRLGLVPQPGCPASMLDDRLIIEIFKHLKPNHLRFTGATLCGRDDGCTEPKGYRCSSDYARNVKSGELVSYISVMELLRCSMVCRQWQRCAGLRSLWEELDLSRFHAVLTDDLALRLIRRAGPRLRSICLNRCGQISDATLLHISRHCPLATEVHVQECNKLTAPVVLQLVRTLATRNWLRARHEMMSFEVARCAFLDAAVVEQINDILKGVQRDWPKELKRRRGLHSHFQASQQPVDSPRGKPGAPADADAEEEEGSGYQLDVALCSECNEVVDLADGGSCSVCERVTCATCSDAPTTCEECCESFCPECRLVFNCDSCQRDFCDGCMSARYCKYCSRVLCGDCHEAHECAGAGGGGRAPGGR